MYKHLPEVLAFHVEVLAKAERPVEGQRYDVMPPCARLDALMWIRVPALVNIPQPRLIPQYD